MPVFCTNSSIMIVRLDGVLLNQGAAAEQVVAIEPVYSQAKGVEFRVAGSQGLAKEDFATKTNKLLSVKDSRLVIRRLAVGMGGH